MKLNVVDRLLILNLLPAEATFANLKILRLVKEALSFSEKEHKELQFKQEGEQTTWSPTAKVPDKEVKIGEIVTQMIVKKLKEMNEEGKGTEEYLNLYEIFIEKL